jgi:hypothetical protein
MRSHVRIARLPTPHTNVEEHSQLRPSAAARRVDLRFATSMFATPYRSTLAVIAARGELVLPGLQPGETQGGGR